MQVFSDKMYGLRNMKLIIIIINIINPLTPNGVFNIGCPRDCVSRHNGGTAGAPLKPLRVDSALRALSTLIERCPHYGAP